VKRKTIYFTAPRQVELREEPVPVVGADEVMVETICSAISAGTEMLVYRGQFPHLDDSHDMFSSNLKYPVPYGYASVGVIRETGGDADASLRDKTVFGFEPHASAYVCHPSSLILAPASLPAEASSLLPNMETAVNLIQDAAPILGERALVIGQGIVGLLVASLLKEFPLEQLVTSDCYELRRRASLDLGVDESVDPNLMASSGYAQKKFDVAFELSGSPSALNEAIALTAFTGRILVGSWYGEKRAAIDLGGTFHRSRIKIISSQVSTIAPELSARWDKARRFEVAWEALRRIQPQKWITHRFPIEDAEKAYRLLDENPQDAIQVLFDYRS